MLIYITTNFTHLHSWDGLGKGSDVGAASWSSIPAQDLAQRASLYKALGGLSCVCDVFCLHCACRNGRYNKVSACYLNLDTIFKLYDFNAILHHEIARLSVVVAITKNLIVKSLFSYISTNYDKTCALRRVNLYENYLRNIVWKIKFILLIEIIFLVLKQFFKNFFVNYIICLLMNWSYF